MYILWSTLTRISVLSKCISLVVSLFLTSILHRAEIRSPAVGCRLQHSSEQCEVQIPDIQVYFWHC